MRSNKIDESIPSIFEDYHQDPKRESWSNCWFCIFGPQSKDEFPEMDLGGRTCEVCLKSKHPVNFIGLFYEDGRRKRRTIIYR